MIVIAIALTVTALIIMAGKGDKLIAGYNMTSPRTRKLYHPKRVRMVVGIYLIIIALMLAAMTLLLSDNDLGLTAIVAFPVVAFVMTLIALLLANSWARKH